MTDRERAEKIKAENNYREPPRDTCFYCAHVLLYSPLRPDYAECGIDDTVRFPVSRNGTCDKFTRYE